jgi:hypothetical protein
MRFLRSLPECADMHEIHVIIDGYAAHLCGDVRALANELRIRLHFIPPGLTDILQRLDRAIYVYEMSQREDNVRLCCIPAAGMGVVVGGRDSPRLGVLQPGHGADGNGKEVRSSGRSRKAGKGA